MIGAVIVYGFYVETGLIRFRFSCVLHEESEWNPREGNAISQILQVLRISIVYKTNANSKFSDEKYSSIH